jgi:hypothetical protein
MAFTPQPDFRRKAKRTVRLMTQRYQAFEDVNEWRRNVAPPSIPTY